ncbi:cation-translocating P-type ATPase [Porcipelethomonas sp.]|uniref:cation-translocating P-type ATPase n=1 Tax=Porcipelethomonas sp. TaxID=2981675 RepID=UPI003EF8C3BE
MTGLTQKQASKLLEEMGSNTLAEKKGNGALKIFAGQFKDVMVMILLGATVISVFLGEIYDAATIIAIVLLNAVLGFIQEYRTEKTLEALADMTAPTAKVIRDGKHKTIPAAELVPGDLVEMEAGDKIPADCVILECSGMYTDEAMLTGESEPVAKRSGSADDRDNSLNRACIAYSGTVVTRGNATALVIATGKNAQVGKISHMINDAEESQTPLQKRLGELGKVVALICIGVCIIVFLAGVLRGEPVFDMLMTGITIAIAAIPEGLPATVTIALALAVNRMLKLNALVNKLHSVETLGCASVICSDKTGTITENKMTVKHIFTDMKEFDVLGNGYKINGEIRLGDTKPNPKAVPPLYELLECGVICSTASISSDSKVNFRNRGTAEGKGEWKVSGDPTEIALLISAAKGGVTRESLRDRRKISEIPFDSDTKMMTVVSRSPSGQDTAYVKGAPDILLNKCSFVMTSHGEVPLDSAMIRRINEEISSLSGRALRVLALAKKEVRSVNEAGSGLVFLGLAAMQDPPREEAKRAVRKCSEAHIKTVMITGDHKETAAAVAKEAGILKGGKVVTGAELDAMTDTELDRDLDKFTVFARVNPSHKLRLVKAYKRKGHIVTMTGDGVNDAPAVKEANVGVAMGITGTDVTKQAADVILLDDNFATLVKAVEQGRGIYANIRKFVRYLLSCNIGEVITMFLGILMGFPMVLLPTQLLLVNLVTDGLPAIALGMEPCEKDIMKHRPRKPDESFFSGGLMFKIVFRGLMIGICTLGCFTTLLRVCKALDIARTGALTTLIVSQLIHVFECKSETRGIFSINYFSNIKLILAVLVSLAVIAAAVYIPAVQMIFSTVCLTKTPLLISLGFSFAVPAISGIANFFKRK